MPFGAGGEADVTATTSASAPTEPEVAPDLRAVGDRIEALLQAAAASGPVAAERAEELVRLVADLYGGGLQRILEILDDAGALTADVLNALAADDLVASLLLVHGLHPHDVATRVSGALDTVRPYLASHGGDVELLGITDDGVVRLRLLGSCDGCASSSVTMTLAVQDAITQAAPEVVGFDVESPRAAKGSGRPLLPLSVVGPADGSWQPLPDVSTLPPGSLTAVTVDGVGFGVLVCRVGGDLLAFRDACARCGSGLGGAVLERRLGGSKVDAVLRCPACALAYDVRAAGTALDRRDLHLEPLPLLTRHGRPEIAVPAAEPR